jgi:hypothetical protein
MTKKRYPNGNVVEANQVNGYVVGSIVPRQVRVEVKDEEGKVLYRNKLTVQNCSAANTAESKAIIQIPDKYKK